MNPFDGIDWDEIDSEEMVLRLRIWIQRKIIVCVSDETRKALEDMREELLEWR